MMMLENKKKNLQLKFLVCLSFVGVCVCVLCVCVDWFQKIFFFFFGEDKKRKRETSFFLLYFTHPY